MRKAKYLTHQFRIGATRYLASVLFAAGAFLTATDCVEAAPIYSQISPEEPIGAFSSNDTPMGQKIADNFFLSGLGPVTIRSLRFMGGYTVRNPPPSTPPIDSLPSDSFRIVILEDDEGSPGTPLPGGEFVVGSALYRTGTNNQLLNGFITPIEYKIDLAIGFTIDTNTEYWITILNNTGPDFSWQWARANGVFDQSTVSTRADIAIGPWNVVVNGGMFFELNDQNIPEPSSQILLLTAISVLQLKRRKFLLLRKIEAPALS